MGANGARELRVHGVGGDAAHDVLGLPHATDVAPVDSTSRLSLSQPIDDRWKQTAYLWGHLTSGSPWFALWTLQLPFTLANLAGWMHPASGAGGGLLAWIRSALTKLSGLVLTVATVLWTETLAAAAFGLHPGRWVAGFALVALALGTSWDHARSERAPELPPPADDAPPTLAQDLAPGGHHLGILQVVHVVALAATVGAVAWATGDLGDDSPVAVIGRWAVAATAVGLTVDLLLAVAAFQPSSKVAVVRWCPSALAAAASHLLLAATATAGLVAIRKGRAAPDLGAALALLDVLAIAIVVGLAVLVVTAVVVLLRSSPYEEPGPDPGPRSERPTGEGISRLAIRLPQVVRHADLAVTALVAAAMVGVAVAGLHRAGELGSYVARDDAVAKTALAVLAPLFVFLVRDLGRNALSRDRRRKVGQLWDVMAFWPRTDHPFAVRPYGDRAVSELRAVLANRTELQADRWVVTAHSQGSVLVFAALTAALADARDPNEPQTPPVDLVTFGSPLINLHAKVFPRHLRMQNLDAVRAHLEQGGPDGGSWVNFWRPNDPVGRQLWVEAPFLDDGGPDRLLRAPNRTAPHRGAHATDAEQDLPIGATDGHSGYRRSQELKAHVRDRLDRPGAAP